MVKLIGCKGWSYPLTLSVPNFQQHLSSAFFFYFNKISFWKTVICKVERLNVKQCRSRWDGSLSRLIWIYPVCKSLLLPPVAVIFHYHKVQYSIYLPHHALRFFKITRLMQFKWVPTTYAFIKWTKNTLAVNWRLWIAWLCAYRWLCGN